MAPEEGCGYEVGYEHHTHEVEDHWDHLHTAMLTLMADTVHTERPSFERESLSQRDTHTHSVSVSDSD